MKVLVTGGAGYIGGTVAGLLAENGAHVVVFDNLSHGRRDLLPPGVELIEGELADRLGLENIFTTAKAQGKPFDSVLHFAALIEAGESMIHPEQYFRNNTASTLALLEAMLAHGPRRLVFSSTAAVYGEPEEIPIKEDARLLPTNAYGESKLLVEHMLRWFQRIHGLRYASLRYFNVAGAPEGPNGITRGEAHEPETHLIPQVLDVALGRKPSIRIYGDDYPTPDGTCIRDYIHVSDLARAHIAAVEWLGRGVESKKYNVGTGRGYSVSEVLQAVEKVTGQRVPFVFGPRREGDPPSLVADSSRLQAELGWAPRDSGIDRIVETAWAWFNR